MAVDWSSRASGRAHVVAHRGASRAARENTVEAFTKARALRADGVELDVRRTADGHLVVLHDPEIPGLGRVTSVTGEAIRSAAPWVPTLPEALDACAGMWVNIEVKSLPTESDWDPQETMAREVAGLVAELGLHDWVLISSFNPAALTAVRHEDPRIATGLVTVAIIDPVLGIGAAADAGHSSLHPQVEALTGDQLAASVERAQAADIALIPWTVDDPGELRRLVDAGITGVITNVPDIARGVVDAA